MTATDHLAIWQRVRDQVPWHDVVPHPVTPVWAVHDGYVDFARRRPGLPDAYDDVRARAGAGATLTPDLLARWNGLTRGIPAPGFRRGTAYAKNGRERYALRADTEHGFAACVAQAADRRIPVTARAARVYLDVAFFHPFDDGNARLAGLALQFVLQREQVYLDEPVPILTAVRRADDADGAAGLARLVHGIAGATHRRWMRQRP
ncbi:Fic family protein [Actinoplanes sp. CA-252034]|uniref:Fic family protein n=1 Tax=Actinoplanes sp. CA-252034 TaxID=3239906 RepID=UPI003D96F481